MACCPGTEWCDLFCYHHDDAEDRMGGAVCWRIWRCDAYWQVMLERLRIMADCLMEDHEPSRQDIPLRPAMPVVRVKKILEIDG